MRVILLCATSRGHLVLKRLTRLVNGSELIVFSFPEEPWEPPFLKNIQETTLQAGGKFFQARQIGADKWSSFWESTAADLMIAVNWRYMVPCEVFQRPKLGSFVFHDSLLPEYRGFSPTVWAMINGENHTGVTLFEMSETFDAGDIIDQEAVAIDPDATIDLVTEEVTQTYLRLLSKNWERLVSGDAPRRPQDPTRATYTCKRLPEDNRIDWSLPTNRIYDLIRAVTSPYSGAFSTMDGRTIRIWSAQRIHEPLNYVGRTPGRIVQVLPGEGSLILTGDGQLLLKTVQLEGSTAVCASEILQSVGQTLGQ